LPTVSGRVTIGGISAPVDIVRDADAIPHIIATTKADAFFGLGYVHAQDRLWQMEFQRRIGHGRLSEVFGDATIPQDRFLRTVGFGRAAVSAWQHLPADIRAQIDAYVAGINAFIDTHHGRLLPPEFLALMEETGQLVEVGGWVLRQACRQNRLWQLSGLPKLPVAVNLSAIQFKQKNLVKDVERVLADTGLEPQYLEFELTESMLLQDTAAIAKTLEGLKALGVKIAIDDFGTGHSSLMHLKRFPIDKLKIDRTFISDIPGDSDDVAITAAIIDLARNMGITSIAEGVDQPEQLAFLRARGCEEMQGFLVSEALPAEQMARWLSRRRGEPLTSVQLA